MKKLSEIVKVTFYKKTLKTNQPRFEVEMSNGVEHEVEITPEHALNLDCFDLIPDSSTITVSHASVCKNEKCIESTDSIFGNNAEVRLGDLKNKELKVAIIKRYVKYLKLKASADKKIENAVDKAKKKAYNDAFKALSKTEKKVFPMENKGDFHIFSVENSLDKTINSL